MKGQFKDQEGSIPEVGASWENDKCKWKCMVTAEKDSKWHQDTTWKCCDSMVWGCHE
jgi:hypothetical protein